MIFLFLKANFMRKLRFNSIYISNIIKKMRCIIYLVSKWRSSKNLEGLNSSDIGLLEARE